MQSFIINNNVIVSFVLRIFSAQTVIIYKKKRNNMIMNSILIKLYPLHNFIISLLVIEQIYCFRVEMKGESLCFSRMQKSCKKIELVQFYIQFECIYPNIKSKLLLAYYATFIMITEGEQSNNETKQSKPTWIA